MMMRTTVSLPEPLLKRAKRVAAARGVSLNAIVTDAVARYVDAPEPRPARIDLPVAGEAGEALLIDVDLLSNQALRDLDLL